MQLKRLRH
uniref:Uncharacterized protein n=1 Tax=Arundo donax TaxID=35708 RepID=A0A0A9EBV7_ARUDO